ERALGASPGDAGEPVLRARGLRKRYGELEAVGGVDLEVRAGEIFAFLGPNGAGKTTTVEILEGYRGRDGGEVEVLGLDPRHATREWRARMGVVLQTCAVQPELTVGELLSLYGSYYPRPLTVEKTLELVGLSAERDQRAGSLSGGQRRRLDVGLALVGDPALLFLDEPTTGFDPSARHHTWEVIAGLRDIGKTVFLTTHYMEEAQALADRVAVIAHGRIVAEGTTGDLGGRDRAGTIVSFRLPEGAAAGELPGLSEERVDVAGQRVEVRTMNPTRTLATLTGWCLERGLELAELEARRPSLEEIYLRLTDDGEGTR
ncbi:MAG TPA: ABC transporter ATP-binding protein, partial [Solirubrobacteraceae bacterium]|nr:ABC transporter ATP-binding protein [Solirubrobacteraceae bacterium]